MTISILLEGKEEDFFHSRESIKIHALQQKKNNYPGETHASFFYRVITGYAKMCNTDDADSFIRSLVVSSWPIRARFEWRVPRCETRQITDYFCVRRLIIHVRCPVAERTGSPQQVVLFPPSYCRTSVQLVYIQDADIFVEQNLEQKLIYIFRLNLCKGFWWDIYRVSIYSCNKVWNKSWYIYFG